ncbi:MAG: ribonuclease PH [Candidatus Omnitrophica bacterium]|nr:ribonuclease PH [Candidatus Omnitrophota bacterium]
MTPAKRPDGRRPDELRKVSIRKGTLKFALGSCLIEMGNTQVVCSASLEERVPPFLKGKGRGWVTAEYGMLPASCTERIQREAAKGRLSGRTQEIQRLIGRSLRSVTDLNLLGERSILLDADVIQGDGGTRTAAITGCFIALAEAVEKLIKKGTLVQNPIQDFVAAVSVGWVAGSPLLDLNYGEDSQAAVDMNLVMTGKGKLVEIQATAEGHPFSKKEMSRLVTLGEKGIRELILIQKRYVHLSVGASS